ncbi:hypothetical protein AB3R30_07255 [Leptolyngbyaceae cyanobacterium UHCC 1019]
MATFSLNTPIETIEPKIEVTVDPAQPLAAGVYRFQLVVVDDSGNASDPQVVEVVVKDLQRPTAVIDAPPQAEFGKSFTLSGERSTDLPPGKIAKYIWQMVPIPQRPIPGPIPIIRRPPVSPTPPNP